MAIEGVPDSMLAAQVVEVRHSIFERSNKFEECFLPSVNIYVGSKDQSFSFHCHYFHNPPI